MRVATGTLFGRKSLTLVEAGEPGGDPWHFLAFEDVEAREIIRLDARYLLVIGCRAAPEVDPVAVFDLVERRRVFEIRRYRLEPHQWCYSPARRAFFFAQREKDWLCHSLYERSIDGKTDQQHRIDGFRISAFEAREDGTIACVEQGLDGHRIAILDPATGEVRLTSLPHPPRKGQPETRLRWLSPDGRWAL
ncbi:MAG TPA: hypothetical protein VN029_12355, partial [Sphingomonas sp.]|nr:hypothetical protein [Sphingomonas sp.]